MEKAMATHSSTLAWEIPWTAAYQASPSVGFSRQEYWSGLPLPSPFPVSRTLQFLSDVFWCWSLHPLYQVFVGPHQSGSLCSLVLENSVNCWCIVSSSPFLILFSLKCLLIRILDLPKDPLIVFWFLSYYPLSFGLEFFNFITLDLLSC